MKKILLVLSIVFVALLSPVSAKDTYIDRMNITVTLDEKGDAHIKEVWNMSVHEGSEVYKVMDNMKNKRISHLEVTDGVHEYTYIDIWNVSASREQKMNKCGLIRDNDRYELCFGIGEYGDKTYTFEYDVSHFVEQYNGDQGFNFAFFSDLSLDIHKATITIEYPNFIFNDTNSDIYGFGYDGYIDYSNGKIVMGTTESLESDSNKMQILMRVDDGSFMNLSKTDRMFDDILDEAKDQNSALEIILFSIGVFVLFIVLLIFLSLNKSKEEMFEDGTPLTINEDTVPLCKQLSHDDLYRYYYLLKKVNKIDSETRAGLISAIILRWVRDGIVVFEKKEVNSKIFGKSEKFEVDLYEAKSLENQFDDQLFTFVKDASGMNMKLEPNEFEKWCRNHYSLLDEWFGDIERSVIEQLKQEGLIKINKKVYKHFGKINDKYDEVIYSNVLKDELYEILGFKKYLLELNASMDMDINQWEDCLIYANLLNVAEQTESVIKKIPQPNPRSRMIFGYHPYLIRNFSTKGVTAANAASASASRVGGGGGFSGGGGGGVR